MNYFLVCAKRFFYPPLRCLLPIMLWALSFTARAQGPVNYADWRLEWAEEFNTPVDTTALAERWRFFYPWGHVINPSFEAGYYTGQGLQSGPGILNMAMRRLEKPRLYRGKEMRYDTPMLISRHLVDSLRPPNCHEAEGFSYGFFEVRLRQPKYPESFPAFWLFGGVPDEIDIFEATSNDFGNNFHLTPSAYWRPSRRETMDCQCIFYNVDPTGNLHDQYHTYGVSWLPDGVIFYYDGIPIRHETRLVPAGCAMALILNVGVVDWARHSTDTMAVDYVRVYRPRRLPAVPAVQRPGAEFPQTEQTWLPAEVQPGRPDQATYQQWRLAPQTRTPQQLALQLTHNYNPACNLRLPLPVAGHWSPPWMLVDGTPDLRIQIPAPDSVHWAVVDGYGTPLDSGTTSGGGTWRPTWPMLAPGAYTLHLRQGAAAMVQPLRVIGRPAGSGPTAAWQQPAVLPPANEQNSPDSQ
jgi:hypothetical protein